MVDFSASFPLPAQLTETPVDSVHSQIVASEVSTSVFRGAYLNYVELVNQIETLTPQSKRRMSIEDEVAEEEQDDHAEFLTALQDSCAFVSRTFENVALNLVRSETGPGRWLRKHAGALISRVRNRSPYDYSSSADNVQVVAKQCLEFSEVNRQALRAVVDKYEKRFGNGLAAAFIDDCLQPTSPNKQAFLVSPLKDELAAISIESPEAKPLRERFSLRFFVPPLCSTFTEMDDADGEEPEFVAESGESVLQCPICFDVKYEPVGLACGHSFCWHCLQDAAKLTTTFTKTQALKLRIADEHIKAACPMCKSTGVFTTSMRLKALDAKASERFPKQYKKKQREAEEREELVLQAFFLQQGIKLTADGIAMGDPVPGGWTHRRLGDSNSSNSSSNPGSSSSRIITSSNASTPSSGSRRGSSSLSPGSSQPNSMRGSDPSDAGAQGGTRLSASSAHRTIPGFIQTTDRAA